MDFKLPSKPTIRLVINESEKDTPSPSPGTPPKRGRRRKFSSENRPRVSDAPPHTQFSVIPSRAISDPRINRRKPLLLLLGAIGIHASAKGLCYPSQRRLASLCGRSRSWAGKYLRELQSLGYVRRLVPPRYRGPRAAWRLQVLWRVDSPTPPKESSWDESVWCWPGHGSGNQIPKRKQHKH
jgi:hypothetical protein